MWRGESNGRSAALVGVAQPIVRCGEVGGVGRRRQVAQRRMRRLQVVVGNPNRDLRAGVVEVEEQRLIEKLVAHAAVEALGEAVLHRLARRDEVPVDTAVAASGEHGVAGELRAVVADDNPQLAVPLDDRRQFASHAAS